MGASAQRAQQYLYRFEAVRPELVTDPDAWTEEDLRVFAEHYDYLRQATEAGVVLLAGRSLDDRGPAIVVLEAASDEEARRFMERDPFVSSGLMRASLHPFRAALVRA